MAELNGFRVTIPEGHESSERYVALQHKQQYSIRMHNHHKANGSCKPADAEVYVDGKYIGTFRIPYGQTFLLERPLDDTGRFTAYDIESSEARDLELSESIVLDDWGVIKVVFKPGTIKCRPVTNVVYYNTYPLNYPYWYTTNHEILCGNTKRGYGGGGGGGGGSGGGSYTDLTNYNTDTVNYAAITNQQSSYTTTCNSESLSPAGTGLSGFSNQNFYTVEDLDYDEPSTTIFLRIGIKDDTPRPLEQQPKKVYCQSKPRRLHSQ